MQKIHVQHIWDDKFYENEYAKNCLAPTITKMVSLLLTATFVAKLKWVFAKVL